MLYVYLSWIHSIKLRIWRLPFGSGSSAASPRTCGLSTTIPSPCVPDNKNFYSLDSIGDTLNTASWGFPCVVYALNIDGNPLFPNGISLFFEGIPVFLDGISHFHNGIATFLRGYAVLYDGIAVFMRVCTF